MAPKKGTKMSLTDFLANDGGGGASWADEMDSLPTAPALRPEGERGRRGMDDFSRDLGRDRGFSNREELPLPTKPPYTAFLGNLAFDLTDFDIEEFFGPHKLKSVKIITDPEGKPKGFGYVEFEDLEGLKEGLNRSGKPLNSRSVRVSVAEPQKERGSYSTRGPSGFDDEKFEKSSWRRDGPLPADDRSSSRGGGGGGGGGGDRMGFGSRFAPIAEGAAGDSGDWRATSRPPPRSDNGPPRRGSGFSTPTETLETGDWRGNRPPRVSTLGDGAGSGRRGSGFSTPSDGPASAADTEDTWKIGGKFRKSSPPAPEGGAGPARRGFRDGPGPPSRQSSADAEEPSDWRNAPRKTPMGRQGGGYSDRQGSQGDTSTPGTPFMRKTLNLLPRTSNSNGPSQSTSPVGSPTPPSAGLPSVKSNPFGAAKPIDVSAREKEIDEKRAKEVEARKEASKKEKEEKAAPSHSREPSQDKATAAPAKTAEPSQGMWRRDSSEKVPGGGHSRQASQGTSRKGSRNPSNAATPPKEAQPKAPASPPTPEAPAPARFNSNVVRPRFSFAAAAGTITLDEEGPEVDAATAEDESPKVNGAAVDGEGSEGKVNGVKEAVVEKLSSSEAPTNDAEVEALGDKIADLAVSDDSQATTETAVEEQDSPGAKVNGAEPAPAAKETVTDKVNAISAAVASEMSSREEASGTMDPFPNGDVHQEEDKDEVAKKIVNLAEAEEEKESKAAVDAVEPAASSSETKAAVPVELDTTPEKVEEPPVNGAVGGVTDAVTETAQTVFEKASDLATQAVSAVTDTVSGLVHGANGTQPDETADVVKEMVQDAAGHANVKASEADVSSLTEHIVGLTKETETEAAGHPAD